MDHSILVPEVSLGPAFCDFLTVTCPPESSFIASALSFLDRTPAELVYEDDYNQTYRLPQVTGTIKIQQSRLFHSVSATGSTLASLRQTGSFEDFLFSLSESPHTVTRLDAAKDYKVDFVRVRAALNSAYPDRRCSLSRKSLRVTELINTRYDGATSGTWYAGRKQKGNITARIYDKSNEIYDKTGAAPLGFLTRVEMTARKRVGCTLRDASNPEPLFYHLASPAFVSRPPGVPDWEPGGESFAWAAGPAESAPPYALLKTRMENSGEVRRLAALAAQMGDFGEEMAVKLLRSAIRTQIAKNGLQEASDGH